MTVDVIQVFSYRFVGFLAFLPVFLQANDFSCKWAFYCKAARTSGLQYNEEAQGALPTRQAPRRRCRERAKHIARAGHRTSCFAPHQVGARVSGVPTAVA